MGSVDRLRNSTLGLVFGIWTTILNFGLGSRTTVFIFRLGSSTTLLNFGSRTKALNFWFVSRTTKFNSGFGSQTTVLNFGLGSRTIAVTSWRRVSSNVSLVVLDNLLFILSKLFFEKLQNRGQHLRIKSPHRRLKNVKKLKEFLTIVRICKIF